jgi:hypothetical protein
VLFRSNFQHFTGSHAVTGSLTVSGSIQTTGSISISGSGLSPLILPNLPVFDGINSNASASAAGLTVGMVYRSGDFLCIVNND